MKTRKFEAAEVQRSAARRELDQWLEILSHDTQFAVHRVARLLDILTLPRRVRRLDQFLQIEKLLALQRERRGWGRPWSARQIQRAYYAKGKEFRRPAPQPVTREELLAYKPVVPPGVKRARKETVR